MFVLLLFQLIFIHSMFCQSLVGSILDETGQTLTNLTEKVKEDVGSVFNKTTQILTNLTDEVKSGLQNLMYKCYGKYGCFEMDPLSTCGPLTLFPNCQDILQIKFFLWTPDRPEEKQIIDPENEATIPKKYFNHSTCIDIFVNGYLGTGDMPFVLYTKDEIFKLKKNCLFISVDYTLASRKDYLTATTDSRMVAAVTSVFIQTLQTFGVNLSKIHLIGFSLGGQIVGQIGNRVPGISKITGVDPAKPLFSNCPSALRISQSDAEFVHIMHCDGGISGIDTPAGHLDVYISGGKTQQPCKDSPLPKEGPENDLLLDVGTFVNCNHMIAIRYFMQSINSECPYTAYECGDYDSFLRGECNKGCEKSSTCAPTGYHADQWKSNARESSTSMFMITRNDTEVDTYCRYHYFIQINCSDDKIRQWRYDRYRDKLNIRVVGENGKIDWTAVHQDSIGMNTEPNIKTIIISDKQIGKITEVWLKFISEDNSAISKKSLNCNNTVEPTEGHCIENFDQRQGHCLACPYIVESILVKNLETGNKATFNGNNTILKSGEEMKFG